GDLGEAGKPARPRPDRALDRRGRPGRVSPPLPPDGSGRRPLDGMARRARRGTRTPDGQPRRPETQPPPALDAGPGRLDDWPWSSPDRRPAHHCRPPPPGPPYRWPERALLPR